MADINSFMSTFCGSSHEYVHQLDPLATFTVTMKFFPCTGSSDITEPSLVDKLVNSAGAAVGSLANNITGGLASAIGGMANGSLMSQHDSSYSTETSFVDYLAPATMLGSSGQSGFAGGLMSSLGVSGSASGMPQIDLSQFVQDITVPFLGQQQGEESQSLLGKFQANGMFIAPDNNELMLTVLNTKLPIVEYLFYPWMREVTLPYWSYESQPYTTATTVIDFSKHADLQYIFCGCRPKTIQTLQPNNVVDGSALKRQVTLMFDFMFISSRSMQVQPSAGDILMGAAGELLGGAGNMLGI